MTSSTTFLMMEENEGCMKGSFTDSESESQMATLIDSSRFLRCAVQ